MAWLRDVLIFLAALCVGSLINWAIYALAYHYRPISPWSPAPPNRICWPLSNRTAR